MAYLDRLDDLVHFPHALVTNVKQCSSEFECGAHEEPVEGHGDEEGNISDERRPPHETI